MRSKRIYKLLLIPILIFTLVFSSVSVYADTDSAESEITAAAESEADAEDIAADDDLNNAITVTPDPSFEESGDALYEKSEAEDNEAGLQDNAGQEETTDNESSDAEEVPSDETEESADVTSEGSVIDETAEEPVQDNTEEQPVEETEEADAEDTGDVEITASEENPEDTDDSVGSADDDSNTAISDTKEKITEEETAKEASFSASGLSLSNMTRYGTFYFNVGSMTASGGVKSARIAVWCGTDKSSKVWYNVDLNTNKATCNVSKHGYNFGTYTAKLFITDYDGNEKYVGYCKKKYDYQTPSCDSVTISMDSTDDLKFTVTVTGVVSYCGVSMLQAPVWSTDDQSDLIWYSSYKNMKKGTFTFTGTLADHKYRQAIYTAHIYLTDNTGQTLCIGGTTKKIKISPGTIHAVYNPDTNNARFSLPSIKHYGLLNYVEYSVWKADMNGSDLKTYTAEIGTGYFSKAISMNKFSGNGTYNVSCYGITKAGTRKYFGETSFRVTNASTKMTYELTRVSQAKVIITIFNANIGGNTADSVEMATWSDAAAVGYESNQDDLVWYEAVNNGDGSFTCTINRNKHMSSGTFHTHIYAYIGSKAAFCLGIDYELYRPYNFAGKYLEVARKSILAVESGGQIYGNANYAAFAPAYNISSSETGITIGAGQWMGARAVKLLFLIRDADPDLFNETAPIIYRHLTLLESIPESQWNYYGSTVVAKDMSATCKRAQQIKAVISTDIGIAIQNALIDENLTETAAAIKNAGVTDIDAVIFLVNVAHLGGTSAAYRIIKATAAAGYDLTMEHLWFVMKQDISDTSSSNQVGDAIYQSRHLKIIEWIYTYLN